MEKKDKTVQITASGKVKIKLNRVASMAFRLFLFENADKYNSTCNRYHLSGYHYDSFVKFALLFDLFNSTDNAGADELKFTISKAEAILLWGVFQNAAFQDASLLEPMMKLHQKLS